MDPGFNSSRRSIIAVPTIQQDGHLDLVLRCMEDERVTARDGPFGDQHQIMLSEIWVGSVYETLRLLVDGRLISGAGEVGALAEDFRLLRIPLKKHEIASDRKLTGPLQLLKSPPLRDASDLYEYDKADQKRSHIMPCGFSGCGSVMWNVIDLKDQLERWIERRVLSDRIVALWG